MMLIFPFTAMRLSLVAFLMQTSVLFRASSAFSRGGLTTGLISPKYLLGVSSAAVGVVALYLYDLSLTKPGSKVRFELGRGPRMQLFSSMFGGNKPDPATNLAKTPALDKTKSDEEWAAILSPTAFKVLRRKATEPRGVTLSKGGFDDLFTKGTYICAGCKTPLYTSEHKFDCGCGWPGFWTNIKDAVYEEADADGFRCEILCSGCGGHLGHVFRNEGFSNPPPNERHCVNGVSLAFVPEGKTEAEAQPATYSGPVYEPR